MAKLIDLTDKKFYTWVVKERDINSSGRRTMWICECENCGARKSFGAAEIKMNQCSECLCHWNDIISKTFNHWVVKEKHGHNTQGVPIWKCECQLCHRIKNIYHYYLVGSWKYKTVKCDCQMLNKENLINKKIGKLTVLSEYIEGYIKYCLCNCDCGNKNVPIKKTNLTKTNKKTKSCGCEKYLKGDENLRHKGRILDSAGYVLLYDKNHSNSDKRGRIREHVLVMSEYLKRPLNDNEFVHHKNSQKTDNRIQNLELWTGGHPKGSRAEDLVIYAKEILSTYSNYQNPTILNNSPPEEKFDLYI